MIPHKLRLRNFMCYREEQSLDFSGIHLACLTGDNGHGKSALLDAMTWALWGRARARRDDELITLGETETWVDFEFGLGPQRYRVWRQRSKKGRGQSDLHLYVWNAAQSDWQLLDDGGLNERQALIIRTLRLDYDTFVNSAFLLQGRADSFTAKTAAERKQVLADVLGLSRYDEYEQRARDQAQARRERAMVAQAELKAMDAELDHRAEHEARLEAARAACATATETLRAAEKEQDGARRALNEMRAQAQQLVDLRARVARAERDLGDMRGQLASAAARLKDLESILARRAEIEEGWGRLEQARKADAGWNERLLQHTRLQERHNRAQRAVDQARAELESEKRRLDERHADLARRAGRESEHAATLAVAQQALEHFEDLATRRDAIVADLRETGERSAALRTEMDRVKLEGQAVNDKTSLLNGSEEAACPLCGQPLTPDHRDRMAADLVAEHELLTERYRAAQAELKVLAERKAELEREERELATELRGRDARQRQAATAEAGIAEARAAAEEQARIAEQVEAVASRLEAEAYAPDARAELAAIQAELESTGYDAPAHTAVREDLARLSAFDGLYQRQLVPALDGIAEARERVEALARQLSQREAELAGDLARRAELDAAVAGMPALEASLTRAMATVDAAADTERRARQQEGGAMQQLAALEAVAARRQPLRAQLDALNGEFGVFNELREAFGKKGIQAMIIESAIPEVETEANRLLFRMSEGRMSIRLETQREKVTGGVAETLDIILSDELGSRPYEMYSGGERFRADLALRIAISRLLARRAGAQLQTLVIDEGFGSQDAVGRSLVVEAINSIQHDFERILVITHIEELKDLFPARIDVEKTASGSRVSIA